MGPRLRLRLCQVFQLKKLKWFGLLFYFVIVAVAADAAYNNNTSYDITRVVDKVQDNSSRGDGVKHRQLSTL